MQDVSTFNVSIPLFRATHLPDGVKVITPSRRITPIRVSKGGKKLSPLVSGHWCALCVSCYCSHAEIYTVLFQAKPASHIESSPVNSFTQKINFSPSPLRSQALSFHDSKADSLEDTRQMLKFAASVITSDIVFVMFNPTLIVERSRRTACRSMSFRDRVRS